MRYLFFTSRLVFGLVFIISGFLKLIDPVGTSLVVAEYFKVLHLGFLDLFSLPVGISLSITEFMVGISVLSGIKVKRISPIALGMMSFFTVLTFFVAIFDPINDCGCFGEFVHLSNWETFYKNIILLACIIPIFVHRKKLGHYFPSFVEWSFIGTYVCFALALTIYSLVRMPFVEFGDFRVGSNISANLEDSQQGVEYETIFIYEKNGNEKEFNLNSLPDSTWVFVDAKSETKDAPDIFDFSVSDMSGSYVTDEILHADYPIYIGVITDIEAIKSPEEWSYFKGIDSLVRRGGGEFLFLVSSSPEIVRTVVEDYSLDGMTFDFADYKTLISLHRSNGGIVYLNDATVVQKWARYRLDEKGIDKSINGDYELVASNRALIRQFYLEMAVLVILLSLVLTRIVFNIYRRAVGTRRARIDG